MLGSKTGFLVLRKDASAVILVIKPVFFRQGHCLFEAFLFFKILLQKKPAAYFSADIIYRFTILMGAYSQGSSKTVKAILPGQPAGLAHPQSETDRASPAAFWFILQSLYGTKPVFNSIFTYNQGQTNLAGKIFCFF